MLPRPPRPAPPNPPPTHQVWNGMFEQTRWALERGAALGLDADRYTAMAKFYSLRAQQVGTHSDSRMQGRPRAVLQPRGAGCARCSALQAACRRAVPTDRSSGSALPAPAPWQAFAIFEAVFTQQPPRAPLARIRRVMATQAVVPYFTQQVGATAWLTAAGQGQ